MEKKNTIEKQIDALDERSNDVKEILGQAPNWVIRWGITVILGVVMVIFIGAATLSYNDIIQTTVTVTSETPPAYIKARTSGRISKIFVKTNEPVFKDSHLAVIENTANYDHVMLIKKRLDSLKIKSHQIYESNDVMFPADLELGQVQIAYTTFISKRKQFLLFKHLNPKQKEIQNFNIQLKEQERLLILNNRKLSLLKTELQIAKNEYNNYQSLFKRGVSSEFEVNQFYQNYLQAKQQVESQKAAIATVKLGLKTLKGQHTQTDILDIESNSSFSLAYEESVQHLKNEIMNWEQRFVLKSTIDGYVSLFDIWSKHQNVKVDESLFTIIPSNPGKIIGRVAMPIKNSGKVKVGQDVIIKLDNYPYYEWGSINGKIVSISAVPKQEEAIYTIYLEIDNLKTSFNKELRFKQEMQGVAEIVIEELTIMQRLFYEFRALFSR